MALDKAVYFLGRVMRDLFDVCMAAFTFYLGVDAVIKDIFVDVVELHLAFFINPAYTGILVA
jgi:hypothetical protein